jgi:hypothetical protein
MGAKHRGKVQDKERAKLISKREQTRRFNEKSDEFVKLVMGMSSYAQCS